jgi:outer membrane protein assembly factor BamC
MFSATRLILTFLLPTAFSACTWLGIGGDDGWLRDREGEYLQAPVVARMDIPAELDTFTIDDLYLIPPPPVGDREFFVRPPPPKPIDSRIREGVVVQQFGERAWYRTTTNPVRKGCTSISD